MIISPTKSACKMLKLAGLRRFWTSLPHSCNLRDLKAPTLVYIYKNAEEKLGQMPILKQLAESQKVTMYRQHFGQVPPQLFSQLEITTVPTIFGILWGKPIAVINSGNLKKGDALLKLLESESEPPQSHDSFKDAALDDLEKINNKNCSLDQLHAQYRTLEAIFKDPLVKLHGPSESQKQTVEDIKRQNGYSDACNPMARILEDVACKEALQGNLEKSLAICTQCCHTFKHIPKVAHVLVKLLPTNLAIELLAEVKLLDTNIVHATRAPGRPVGGVARKRRGFRGKYVWHGPDYRPKRYKPKDFHLYRNEWQCYQDKNLPLA